MRKRVERGVMAAVIGVAGVLATPSNAQEIGPLLDRLDRLERDIKTLNFQVSRGENPPASVTGNAGGGSAVGVPSDPLPKYAAARLNQRMDSLEQDLRAGTGNMETVTHQLQQLTERFDKLIGDIDYRLGVIEGRLGIGGAPVQAGQVPAQGALQPGAIPAQSAPGIQAQNIAPAPTLQGVVAGAGQASQLQTAPGSGSLGTVSAKAVEAVAQGKPVTPNPSGSSTVAAVQPTPAVSAPAPSAVPSPPSVQAQTPNVPAGGLPAGSPREQYTYAFNLLRQTNYDQAEIALKQFVETHGDNPLAGNARYWLGETFYVRADYQQAAQVFFEGFQSDPKNSKAPDMLLKLGMSLAQLGKKAEACATYDKVAADFGKSSSRIKTALERERKRAACS